MKKITREELKAKMDSGEEFILIEALADKYWRETHLPGALQLDYPEVKEKAGDLLPNKNETIVVYCASSGCMNSRLAAATLEKLGYTDVYEYEEGKEHWIEAGFPVESGQ